MIDASDVHDELSLNLDISDNLNTKFSYEISITYSVVKAWVFLGRTLFARFYSYDIIQRVMPGGVRSELLIHNTTPGDAGIYTCKVSNPFGQALALTRLQVLGM